MKYLLALIFPPIAVLACGKPGQAVLNLLLTFLFIVPGVVHAVLVVASHEAEQRNRKLISAIKRSSQQSYYPQAYYPQQQQGQDFNIVP